MQEEALAYVPVLVSTLTSSRVVPFRVAHVRQQQRQTTVLAANDLDGKPVPVAHIISQSVGAQVYVAVRPLAVTVAGRDPALMQLLTLEHLYAMTLRMDPGARFCVVEEGRDACDSAISGTSHAAVLLHLARARTGVATKMAGTLKVAPWQVVTLAPSGQAAAHHDSVSVRVMEGPRAMPRVTVFFHRAPHSGCQATTDTRGLAKCDLVDHHGHTHAHEGEEHSPVLVTYPGEVRAERALLPTTLALLPGQ